MESEKTTEAYLRDRVKALGGKAYKWVSPGCAGVPDRIVIFPGGRAVFVELKSEGMTSTGQQKKRQAELRALGCTVYADIDTKEKVNEVLRKEAARKGSDAT
jgi:hypothetical protein